MDQQISSELVNDFFASLGQLKAHHRSSSPVYKVLKHFANTAIKPLFSSTEAKKIEFGPIGNLVFPFHNMGAINSLNLFDIDELILFAFYSASRNKYKKVLDLGANIGLHSVILSKCGYEVRSFEPDPVHFELIQRNLKLNDITKATPNQKAVSNRAGRAEFVRIKGNTTGSHLAGDKSSPYGELDRFEVELQNFGELIEWPDFIKMDVEGHEALLIQMTTRAHWEKFDAVMEVGNEKNQKLVFEHLNSLGVNMFPQKLGWERATSYTDLPKHHSDGSLFVSAKSQMDWTGSKS